MTIHCFTILFSEHVFYWARLVLMMQIDISFISYYVIKTPVILCSGYHRRRGETSQRYFGEANSSVST